MAPSLVNINTAYTGKERLLHPFPTAISIKQDAIVGKAEPTDGLPKVLVSKEDEDKVKIYSRVR